MSLMIRLFIVSALVCGLYSCSSDEEPDSDSQKDVKEQQLGPFISDYRIAVDSARAAKKPLLVYFSGYSCTDCRTFEEVVLHDPKVMDKLPEFVVVQLMTDDKSELPGSIQMALDTVNTDSLYGRPIETIGDLWTVFQELNFDTIVQPYVVTLTNCEQWIGDPIGGAISTEDMATYLNDVLEGFPIDTATKPEDSLNVIMYHPGFVGYWDEKVDTSDFNTNADQEEEILDENGTQDSELGENQNADVNTTTQETNTNETNETNADNNTESNGGTNVVPGVPSVSGEHVVWYPKVKKTGDGVYDLMITATIDDGWHIYSVYQDPTIGAKPTKFTFQDAPQFDLVNRTGDKGSKNKYIDLWGADAKVFEKRALFRQQIRSDAQEPFNVHATVTYMPCNGQKYLPGKSVQLTFLVDPTN